MKTFLHVSLVLLLAASLFFMNDCSFSHVEEIIERPISISDVHEQIEVPVLQNEENGILLDASVQEMNRYGYHAGDRISVTIEDEITDLLILTQEEEYEEPVCLFLNREDNKDEVVLKGVTVSQDATSLSIDLKEKQVLSDSYPANENVYRRTNERSDYPGLNDADYANFRMVKTEGIKEGVLYRSSSPVNPKINRNSYADAKMKEAGIRTVLNLADHPYEFSLFEDKEKTYYVSCDYILLDLSTFYHTEEFEEGLVEGLRCLIGKSGPYLIHCTEGKDRTGFLCAVLECLMGADIDEVISDYMKTYQNYYGIRLGTYVYDRIAQRTVIKDLKRAFECEDLYETDLCECAKSYLEKIGLNENEIVLLQEKLS